ncbi:MAG: hypothetical protein K0S44_170 [Bacteroidetes bacterium]|jgi:hypothetical protein|nr:hypothetical protein [Bacteroidota bacterium]
MKTGKSISKTVKHFCFLFLFFIAGSSFAQNGVNTDISKQQNIAPAEELIEVQPAAPVLVKQFGEYKVMLEDGIKVVYDANGIPQMLNADDFEKIYWEQEKKKAAEKNSKPNDKK